MAKKVSVERIAEALKSEIMPDPGAGPAPQPDVIVYPGLGVLGHPPPRACNFCDRPATEGCYCAECRREMLRLPHIA